MSEPFLSKSDYKLFAFLLLAVIVAGGVLRLYFNYTDQKTGSASLGGSSSEL